MATTNNVNPGSEKAIFLQRPSINELMFISQSAGQSSNVTYVGRLCIMRAVTVNILQPIAVIDHTSVMCVIVPLRTKATSGSISLLTLDLKSIVVINATNVSHIEVT